MRGKPETPMMEFEMREANFQVDSRLATLLSQDYSSTEKALKELVDNAWDADAEEVSISLPEAMSDGPMVVRDNGNGMTLQELESQYLKIASDRRLRRGERTAGKQRLIKGKKGIGKFAGLMAASVMSLSTKARGQQVGFKLSVDQLESATDIERLSIPLSIESCVEDEHGTTITLSHLRQGLRYPNANRLRQELVMEYGRQKDFKIIINEKPLGIDDISGEYRETQATLSVAGDISLRFAISDKKSGLRQPGITLMVDGKAVGKPSFFGLEQCEDFPPKLLKKLYGEIDASGIRDYVTAGWDTVIDNSEGYQQITAFVQEKLREAFTEAYGMEMRLSHARLQKALSARLEKLPEHKRGYADRAIKKILEKYYDEPPHKVDAIAFVVLEAVERSDYRSIVEHLADARRRDIGAIADALEQFGMADMAMLVEQAQARMAFLDWMEEVIKDDRCLEATVHKAFERSLWILGAEYSLFSSNEGLQRQIEQYLGEEYRGCIGGKRPDLLLNENLLGEYLLIEFKRPSHGLTYDDYQQATRYRHDFLKHTSKPVKVLVIGGRRSPDFPTQNLEPNVGSMLFIDVISTARRNVEWQLETVPNK